MEMTGAGMIVETLLEQGADTIFGYPGGQVLPLYDELYKNRDRIRAFFDAKGIPVFDTEIRVNIDIDRAHSHRKSIFEFDNTKSGAQDYHNLACEVIARVPKEA